VIQAPGHPSSSALAAVAPSSNYFASATHYESMARRIAAALSGGGRFVLVTDDPPANSRALSLALSKVAGPCQAVIGITCEPELRSDDLRRLLARPRANGGAAGGPKYSLTTSSLFVFDGFDRLSDRQIEDVYESMLHGDQMDAAGVLLARPDLLDRLEGPALRFLKEGLAAHFRVQEVGDDEVIPFLHNQLLAQGDRRSEARGFRRGILISLSLAACGVGLAASTGAFLLLHKAERSEESLSIGKSSLVSGEASVLRPAVSEAASAMPPPAAPRPDPAPAFMTTSPSAPALPPINIGDAPPDAPSALEHPPVGRRLSATESAARLGRGAQHGSTATTPRQASSDEQRDEMLQDSEIQRHHHASLDEGRVAGTPEIRLPEQTQMEKGTGFYGYVVRPGSNPEVRHAASRSSGVAKAHRDKTAAELNRAELSRLLRDRRALGRAPLR
jgi:hypothetical protein